MSKAVFCIAKSQTQAEAIVDELNEAVTTRAIFCAFSAQTQSELRRMKSNAIRCD